MDALRIAVSRQVIKKAPPWVSRFYKFFSNAYVRIAQIYEPAKFLKKIKRGSLFIPEVIYIETTNICNCRCIMCPHTTKMKRPQGNMPWDLFKKIVDECGACLPGNLTIFLHSYGEPLLDPLLFQRIKYIKQILPACFVRFNSNAMLLDENRARQLLESGIDSVTFSIDAASGRTYERIRQGPEYAAVKKNLDNFFKLKKACRSAVKVIMQMVVCEINQNEIKEYKRQWAKKADFVIFKPMHNFLDMGVSTKTKKLADRQMYFCSQPFGIMIIHYNGDIGLCCWDYDDIAGLGNVRENKIIDIYNNERFRQIRIAMCNKDTARIAPCNRCSRIYGQDIWL